MRGRSSRKGDQEVVRVLFEACGLRDFFKATDGKKMVYIDRRYVLRHFVMGDHMMMWKVTGGNGLSSGQDG